MSREWDGDVTNLEKYRGPGDAWARLCYWWTSPDRWWSYESNRGLYEELNDYYREQR